MIRPAALAAVLLTTLLIPVPAADIVRDDVGGSARTPMAGRSPDIVNVPGGTWTVVAFDGFQAFADGPAKQAVLACNGDSNGAIALPLSSTGAYRKPVRFAVSAVLMGANPGLGFYHALPIQDPDGVQDVFFGFTGLQLLGDGTLVLRRAGRAVRSVPYVGRFDAAVPLQLAYEIDTGTGTIAHVSLHGSTADYTVFGEADGVFSDAATTFLAIAALGHLGRDRQATAGSVVVEDRSSSPAHAARPAPATAPAADPAILVRNGARIGFMGDSITVHGNSPAGYVQLTIAGLRAAGVEAIAIPAGHSGNTSANMVGRTSADILHAGADWMTLSCGVNDVGLGVHGCELEAYQRNVRRMVAKAQGWGVRVVLLTPTPISEDPAHPCNRKLEGYVGFLRGLASEKRLLLADMNAAFWSELGKPPAGAAAPGKRLHVDDFHPNEAGQRLMAATLLKTLGVPAR